MLQRSHRTNVLFFGILLSIVVVFCVGRFLIFHADGVRTGPLSVPDRLVLPATAGLVGVRSEGPALAEVRRVPGWVHGPEEAPPDESLRVVARERAGGELVAEAEVGPEGRFELHLPVGGTEEADAGWRIELDGRFLFLPAPLELQAGREGTLELEAELGAWVTASLLAPGATAGARGGALEAARVLLRPGAGSETAGEDGSGLEAWRRLARTTARQAEPGTEHTAGIELRAVPTSGAWHLTAGVEGFVPRDVLLEGLLPGEHRHLTLELFPGERLAGRVVDDAGQALPGARVDVRAVDATGELLVRSAETADDGTFALSGLPAGELELVATHEGFLPGIPSAFGLPASAEAAELVLVLHSGAVIAGRITWEDGTPAPGERIVAVRAAGTAEIGDGASGGGGGAATAAEDGTFRVEGLAPGTYTLRADVERRSAAGVLEVASVRTTVEAATGAPGAGSNVHLELAPRLRLAGVVADRTGRPVRSFRVRAWPEEGSATDAPLEHAFETEDGAFRLAAFTPGAWRVAVDAPGHLASAPRRLVLPGTEGVQRFVLPAASAVAGLVLGTDGEPRPGARVRVCTADGATLTGVGARADAHGRFRVDGLAPGAVALVAEAEGEVASEAMLLELERGRVLEHLVLRLRAGGWIEGTALDGDGRPAPGRLVHVARMDPSVHRSTRADATGRFRIERLLPGEWQAWCQGDGPAGTIESDAVLVRDGGASDLVLGGPAPEPVVVTGRVVDADGPVAAGIQLLAEGRGPVDGMKLADAGPDGRFEVRVDRPGRYLALVRRHADGGATATTTRAIAFPVDVSQDGGPLALELPAGRVAGRVVAPDGAGLAGVHVRLAPAGALPIVVPPGAGAAEHRTDAEGRFAFEHLEPGAWALTAFPGPRAAGGASGWSVARVEVPERGTPEEVELVLGPGGGIAGRVVDADGRPVPAAHVWARSADGAFVEGVSAVTTDAGGRFHLPPLSPGNYTLLARTREGAAARTEPLDVVAGETAEAELELAPGGALVVATVGVDGEPLAARLAVQDLHGREVGGLAAADEAGRLWERGYTGARRRLGPLPPGSYRVLAVMADGRTSERAVEVVAGETVEVVMSLGRTEAPTEPPPDGTY